MNKYLQALSGILVITGLAVVYPTLIPAIVFLGLILNELYSNKTWIIRKEPTSFVLSFLMCLALYHIYAMSLSIFGFAAAFGLRLLKWGYHGFFGENDSFINARELDAINNDQVVIGLRKGKLSTDVLLTIAYQEILPTRALSSNMLNRARCRAWVKAFDLSSEGLYPEFTKKERENMLNKFNESFGDINIL